ncbi:hypothetical protein C7S17_5086 [Burkholderia thailandensis]|nr:hypothetical protein [Burkholderia thailandensis]
MIIQFHRRRRRQQEHIRARGSRERIRILRRVAEGPHCH